VPFVCLALQAGWINSEDANPQLRVFGDFLVDAFERNVRAAAQEQLAVVIRVIRIDEVHLADGNSGGFGAKSLLTILTREGVADPDKL
jgi:hypothetical protein